MRRQKGFTLIELLIVIAIIGIIAAIAIPNLINAINRARQRRTMADIRSIGTALEAYSVDFGIYPKGPITGATSNLQSYLVPTYIKTLPRRDGWSRDIQVSVHQDNYSLWSYAKDGSGGPSTWVGGQTTDFSADIVFANGQFYQWPEGVQTN
jgi:type II secretion system protein G